ncbi:hypothetical protein KA531_02935 [Candidatus Saccharibacteria bacterium]|nr:hypothetical protein [Candidatus Saccharibacteria bacterium]
MLERWIPRKLSELRKMTKQGKVSEDDKQTTDNTEDDKTRNRNSHGDRGQRDKLKT